MDPNTEPSTAKVDLNKVQTKKEFSCVDGMKSRTKYLTLHWYSRHRKVSCCGRDGSPRLVGWLCCVYYLFLLMWRRQRVPRPADDWPPDWDQLQVGVDCLSVIVLSPAWSLVATSRHSLSSTASSLSGRSCPTFPRPATSLISWHFSPVSTRSDWTGSWPPASSTAPGDTTESHYRLHDEWDQDSADARSVIP